MIKCKGFYNICKKNNLTFFSGVPDSTFKSWMSYLDENKKSLTNIPAVNECEAVAICAGYHLSTGKIGIAYMQNSGLGKTINPLTSLCDPKVYSIPILLLIGWRGEPGLKDASQHHKMGPITTKILDTLEIPYTIIDDNIKKLEKTIKKATRYMTENNSPYALVVRKNIFETLTNKKEEKNNLMSREEAIKIILKNIDEDTLYVSTTGKISRELFENHVDDNLCENDFYNIGAMGCAQSIALSISLQKKNKKILVFDGDGSVLMQMGALATIGSKKPSNFYHIIFDNKAHDSTGGQPTVSNYVDFTKIAEACGYKKTKKVSDQKSLKEEIKKIKKESGPYMLVVKVKKGARKNLGRPNLPPKEHKKIFMKKILEK